MLVVLTCYFNPNRCKHRLKAYKEFRSHLKRADVTLHTIELSINDEFQLSDDDADVLKQLRTKSLMFQKERMLNLLIEELPPEYKYVCWMDCDIIYLQDDWPSRIIKSLESHVVTQPYQYAVALPDCKLHMPGTATLAYNHCFGSGMIRRSFSYYHQMTNRLFLHHGHVGYVWAARRDFLDKHKLYDPIITGCGDLFMGMAFFGAFEWIETLPTIDISEEASHHFFDWAFAVADDLKENVGFTEDLVIHLWHGDIGNRNYLEKSKILELFDFDPTKDIKKADNGCWEWSSNKPGLHAAVSDIFRSQQ